MADPFSTFSALPDDDEERRKLRAWAALAGRNIDLPETPDLRLGGVVQLPEVQVKADPNYTEPPARMSADEFPDPLPEDSPEEAPPTRLAEPQRLAGDELPPDAPSLARLAQMRSQEPEGDALHVKQGHGLLGGGAGWAVIADLVLNKGRGIGPILALSSAGAQEDRELNRELRRAQIEKAKREPASYSPEMMAYRQALLEQADRRAGIAEGNLAARNTTESRLSEAQSAELDPNSPQAQVVREHLAGVGVNMQPGASIKAMRSLGPAISKQIDIALSPQTNEIAADRAGQISNATLEDRKEIAKAGIAERADVRALNASPIPGSVVTDPQAVSAALTTPAERSKAMTVIAANRKINSAFEHMKEIRKRVGVALWSKGDKSAYDAAYQGAIGAFTNLAHSGVLNAGEYPRYAAQIPPLTLTKEDVADGIVRSFTGRTHDTNLERLEGLQSAFRANADEDVGVYGLGMDWAAKPAQQSQPDPSAPSAGEFVPKPVGKSIAVDENVEMPPGAGTEPFDEEFLRRHSLTRVR